MATCARSPTTAGPSLAERRAWVRDYDRVAEAIRWLAEHRVEQPRLGELATAMALSPGHLQRTFTRFAGVSPARLLRWLTADAARRLLRERVGVLDTASHLGLSSTGRLHDLVVTFDAATPGELARGGRGLEIRTGVHATPLGDAFVAVGDRGVMAVQFVDDRVDETRGAFAQRWPAADITGDEQATAEVAEVLRAALMGTGPVAIRVFGAGTNLQLKVWEALLRIPTSRVATYRQVAEAAGRPDAVRAVSSAIARNPVAAMIPCHRVLRATGGLGGYRWDPVRKHAMLAREVARDEAAHHES